MRRDRAGAGGEWLRVAEVVTELHSQGFDASVSSVHRWTNDGCDGQRLECRRIGRAKYVHRDALEAFIRRDATCRKAGESQQFGSARGLSQSPKGGDGAQLASGDAQRRLEQVDAYLASCGLLPMLASETVPEGERSEVSEASVTRRHDLSGAGGGSRGVLPQLRAGAKAFPYPVNADSNAN